MTLKPARLLVALFAAAALPALAQNIAVVNGKPIPSSRADTFVKQVLSQSKDRKDTPELRAMIKDELITRELLIQEADKQGLGTNAEVKKQIEVAREGIILQAFVADYTKKHPVSDAEIQAEYDKYKAQAGDKEYRARHILVDKEEDAKAIIAKLKGGAKFEDLAKQSKDAASAAEGGDLDWASPGGFVKPFADALQTLKKGEVTDTPVKTDFGYHVIRLDDTRPSKPRTLEEVKPQIAQLLQQKKLQAYHESLRAKAKIQ